MPQPNDTTTAVSVLEKYGYAHLVCVNRGTILRELSELSKKVLSRGPACGGNEVALSNEASILAAMCLVMNGQGQAEIDLED